MKIYKRIFLVCALLVVLMGIFIPTEAEGISIKKEEELSREFLSVVFRYYKVIDSLIVVNYINDLGQKILSAFPSQPFKYHFYVIKDDSLNAFASPAGHIFVNSGLIQAMESEEELAGVIAHEIAHASLRHISKKIEQSKKQIWQPLPVWPPVCCSDLVGPVMLPVPSSWVQLQPVRPLRSLTAAMTRLRRIRLDSSI